MRINFKRISVRLLIAGLFLSAHAAFAQTTIAKWTFESSVPTTAGPFSPEIGSGSALGFHASGATVYSNPVGNGSTESFSANNWSAGDYYQFSVSTIGNTNISVSFDQTSSSTGPGQNNFAYSTDGINFTTFGSTYTVLGISWSSTVPTNATAYTFDLSSITALNNQPAVYFRMVDASTVSAGGGTVGTGGSCRVDNVTVFANNPSPLSINTDPQDTTANVWTSPSLSVVVDGPLPHYQWYKDGNPINDDGNVSGTSNSTLSFSNVVHANAGVYKVVVSNSINSVTSAPATLTVVGFAIVVDHTNALAGSSVSDAFSYVDAQGTITPVSATSANQSILPDANIGVTTTVPNVSGNITMTPLSGTSGIAIVTYTATDGSFTTNASFPLVVVSNSLVLLNDSFDYSDGPLVSNSANLWRNNGGTPGDMQVVSGFLYLSRSASEDANALLIGQPYLTNSATKLYSKFTVNFSAADTPTSTGSYLAHFKDSDFGYRCRVWVSTNSSGQFRLGIGNSSDADKNSGEFPLDIVPGTTYTVVTRLVVSNNVSTIWIDPSSESDLSVTATDALTNLVDISSYAFRQNAGMSKSFVDDLVVGTSFGAVTGNPESTPIPLGVQRDGSNIVLSWSDPSFALQAAPFVTGIYTNIPGATSPYTNTLSVDQKFYRLQK